MAADGPHAPGWQMRARLLAADLIAFDARRLGWVLALRAILGLALPLLTGHALDQPHFVWIGFGAYLLTIGDCTDDGDRAQPLRILTGAMLGSLALGTGVLAGGSLVTAVAGMLVWDILAGMMGIYGNAFATISLPIVWAYVELGLPATDHTIATALLTSGVWVGWAVGIAACANTALWQRLRAGSDANGDLLPRDRQLSGGKPAQEFRVA